MDSSVMGLDPAALAGVRIVELAQFVFVPGCGAILADHGAEVIRVEAPTGDPLGRLHLGSISEAPINLSVEQNNRNKRSVAIDLKHPEGRELLLRLVETADVFMTNLRPDALDRLGLGLEPLRARNPRIIYARGNALGYQGEDAGRPGFDAASYWARGGIGEVVSAGRDDFVLQRPGFGDHSGSVNLALGIAMALFRREKTGEPSLVETSLLATAMWALSSDVVQAARNPAFRADDLVRNVETMPLVRAYPTADGRLIQLVLLDSDRFWQALCAVLGEPDLAVDDRFLTGKGRIGHAGALYAHLSEVFARHTLAEWKVKLADFEGAWEPVQTAPEVAADPQAVANGYIFEVPAGETQAITLVSGPVSIDGKARAVPPARAPRLGQDSDMILGTIGVTGEELAALRAAGTIG